MHVRFQKKEEDIDEVDEGEEGALEEEEEEEGEDGMEDSDEEDDTAEQLWACGDADETPVRVLQPGAKIAAHLAWSWLRRLHGSQRP